MDTIKILSSDYLDILFENRNKAYGSYALRKHYNRNLGIAVLVLLALCALVAAYGLIRKRVVAHDTPANRGAVTLVNITIDRKKIELPKPVATQALQKRTTRFTPPIVERNENVQQKDVPPAQADINTAGGATQQGNAGGTETLTIPGSTGGNMDVIAMPPAPIPVYAEQMPTAGYDLGTYLAKNLRYPENARESNIEGKVAIRFVVNEDGTISDVTVLRGIGGGCDEEAVRVMSAMPKWKPGRQNGKPVKVYFTLPIMFRLE